MVPAAQETLLQAMWLEADTSQTHTIDLFCGRFLSCACINTKAIAFCMQAKAGSASMAVMLRHLLLLCRHQKNQPGCRLP